MFTKKTPWSVLVVAAVAIHALSCSAPGSPRATRYLLANRLTFALLPDSDGRYVGLDIDGEVSSDDNATLCSHDDVVGIGGDDGVDAQLATLNLPVLLGALDLSSLLQQFVNEGNLSLLVELEVVRETRDTQYIRATLYRGTGPLDIGTNGFAVPGQTFDIDPETEPLYGSGTVANGVLDVTLTGTIEMPFALAQVRGPIHLSMIHARAQLDSPTIESSGAMSASGLIGGAVLSADLISLVDAFIAQDPGLQGRGLDILAARILGRSSDVESDDGMSCDRVSVGIEASFVDAFVFPEDQ